MVNKKRARESRAAIERLYISMRHLFNRGSYKPMGISGQSMIDALLTLKPEIYGDIEHQTKVELEGLLYVIDRLPKGIEECNIIKLIAKEGFKHAGFEMIVPPKRRRSCFRIDENRMYIQMTRGRSDVYDIMTHLSFIYLESNKIKRNALDSKGTLSNDWKSMELLMQKYKAGDKTVLDSKNAMTYLANVLGRTLEETMESSKRFYESASNVSLFGFVYGLGACALKEFFDKSIREVSFSTKLQESIGNHTYGEKWATKIKTTIFELGLIDRPLHIISANLHSIKNTLFAHKIVPHEPETEIEDLMKQMLSENGGAYQAQIDELAIENGMTLIEDSSGTNLNVQLFNFEQMNAIELPSWIPKNYLQQPEKPLLLVMDYAFGEQAFECMDELLKPYEIDKNTNQNLRVKSISVMGKAGILSGKKGDIMVPTAHVFEGTADNYPIENQLTKEDLSYDGIDTFEGTLITVLGTSLQNRDVLEHFLTSSWNAVGLEMEGAHYQKAIQSASMIRKSIDKDVKVAYAYYASDNPLVTGATLAHGSLGFEGVVSTYFITKKIIQKILKN